MSSRCFFGIHKPVPSDDLFFDFECERCGFVSPTIERKGFGQLPPLRFDIADQLIEDLHTRKARK